MLKLQIIGHLGHSARTSLHEGKQVINFSLAHSEKYKDKNGVTQEKTTWVDCTYWSDSKVHQYLNRGTLVYVEGLPFVKQYTGRDGLPKYALSIRVNKIELLKNGQQDASPAQPNNHIPEPQLENENSNDDLPF